jgi:hypothetical protein
MATTTSHIPHVRETKMPRVLERLLEWFLIKTKPMLIWDDAMYLNLEPGMEDPIDGKTIESHTLADKWGKVALVRMDEETLWRARYGPDNDDPLYIRTEDYNQDEFETIVHFAAHIVGRDFTEYALRYKALEAVASNGESED